MVDFSIFKQKKEGLTRFVDNRQDIVRMIRFSYLLLRAGEEYRLAGSTSHEQAIILLSGAMSIFCDGYESMLGPRRNVFLDKAWAAYVPLGESAVIRTESGCEALVCGVMCSVRHPFAVVTPGDVRVKTVGSGAYKRSVHDIFPSDFPAHRIIAGETFNPAGNWSSFPPHKHDTDRTGEDRLEEVYYYRLYPENGFGFQRIYSPERNFDRAYVIKDHSVVMIPFGYHPVAASPGYDLYYFWLLAGSARRLNPYTDPEHKWLLK
ncbi:MAG: 5-deoxy-glucuronate isomerase [Candidatus Auribacterota bacterium]